MNYDGVIWLKNLTNQFSDDELWTRNEHNLLLDTAIFQDSSSDDHVGKVNHQLTLVLLNVGFCYCDWRHFMVLHCFWLLSDSLVDDALEPLLLSQFGALFEVVDKAFEFL